MPARNIFKKYIPTFSTITTFVQLISYRILPIHGSLLPQAARRCCTSCLPRACGEKWSKPTKRLYPVLVSHVRRKHGNIKCKSEWKCCVGQNQATKETSGDGQRRSFKRMVLIRWANINYYRVSTNARNCVFYTKNNLGCKSWNAACHWVAEDQQDIPTVIETFIEQRK